MDEATIAERRVTAARPDPPADDESRFRIVVQSPLRAGLLRFLNARPDEAFEVESLMSTFGRMRLDIDNCLKELVAVGLVRVLGESPVRYVAQRPERPTLASMLDAFLERRAAISVEDQAPSVQRFREMIGRDEKMLIVFEWIRTAAKSDISVLILGPTGSGKEVVARMIHELSRRGKERFQAVNCAALPDTLFESELFGYEKGAFTGAHDRKPGRLELADRGTLFLDEIGDLSPVAQAKLLRALEERRFERLGGQKSVHVDFRLISATNRPLDLFVRDGRFREDLYYRINAFAIRLPSLRERQVDIPVLASRFLARYCAANGLPLDAKTFAPEAMTQLQTYTGPATSASSKAPCHARRCRHRAGSFARPTSSSCTRILLPTRREPARLPTLREAERAHIHRALESTGWNKKETARLLEISRGTLYRKILEYCSGARDQAGRVRAREPGEVTLSISNWCLTVLFLHITCTLLHATGRRAIVTRTR